MEPLAALAAVLTSINAILRIISGFRPACSELLSDNGNTKGEKKFNKIITCLLWVEQKVPEEVKRRTDSNCSETSITADLKPLDGELAEARSLISDWRNKNCLGKWWAAKEFKKKLEKSEEAIYQRVREFSSYTDRYEATQHTEPVEETAKSVHLQGVSYCTLNLNQGSITIQPCNEHPHPSRIMKENNGHLMEKKNQNQKGNNVHLSPMEKANQNQNQLRMKKENNVHLSPMEKANQNQNQLEMEKENNVHLSPMEKANQNQNQLRMEKENNVHLSPMEKANQSPMERGKVHPDHEGNPGRPQTQQAVLQEGNPGRPQTQQAVSQEKKEFEDRVRTVIFIVFLVLVVIRYWTAITK